MSTLAHQLVTLLFGNHDAIHRTATELSASDGWPQVVRLAHAWRVTPELRQRTIAHALPLNASAQRALREQSAAAAAHATLIAHRAATALAQLARAAVPAVAFKGIGAVAGLYRGAGQRMVSDIDVLIRSADIEPSCDAVHAIGFTPTVDRLHDYIAYLDQRPYEGAFSGNHFLVLKDADGVEIDLHWRLGTRPPPALTAEAVIARAEPASLFGIGIHVAAPPDAIVLAAHHVLRDNFNPATAVKDLSDIAAWWSVQPARWVIADVVSHAQRSGLAVPLFALWIILVSFNPDSPAQAGVVHFTRMCNQREHADATRLCELFHAQLSGRRLNLDLLRLLSPTVIARFLTRRVRTQATVDYFSGRLQREMGLAPHQTLAQRARQLLRDLMTLRPHTLGGYRALLRVHRASQDEPERDA